MNQNVTLFVNKVAVGIVNLRWGSHTRTGLALIHHDWYLQEDGHGNTEKHGRQWKHRHTAAANEQQIVSICRLLRRGKERFPPTDYKGTGAYSFLNFQLPEL